ncbi:MAG: DUF5343 domain-containing protein [Nitrososphaerota archaeon]
MSEEETLPIPFSLNFDRWKYLVKILVQNSSASKVLSYDSLSKLTGMAPSTISGNAKFLKRFQIITSDSTPSAVIPTELGKEYGEALVLNDVNKQKEVLMKIVKTSLTDLIGFCEAQKISPSGFDYDKLFNKIKLLAKVKDISGEPRDTDRNYRRAIETIIEMLISSDVLDNTFLPSDNKIATKDTNGNITKTRKKFELPTNCQQDWLVTLFSKLREHNPTKIDKAFIRINVKGHNHEGSIHRIAKFLGICDEQDNRSDNYDRLLLFGSEEFKTNLAEVIKEKYTRIFSLTTNLATLERGNLVNFIVREYNIGATEAERAVSVLVQLCRLSSLQLSDSLANVKRITQKKSEVTKPQGQSKIQEPINDQEVQPKTPIQTKTTSNSIEVKLNINVDASDYNSFSNVLRFFNELKSMSNDKILVELSTNSSTE